jgi:RNase P/RNase MRP subunit p30
MIDVVFPKGNEADFISMAERLGLSGLCFVYPKPTDISSFQKSTKLKLFSGVLCSPNDVRKFRQHLTFVSAPDDQQDIRHILESCRPSVLFGLEFSRRRDFMHHRASGLNHILAALARDKDVSIGFNFSALLSASPRDRAVFMGRMMQNISFARKFRFKLVAATFARSPWHLRSEHDLASFFVTLGMTASEAKKALDWVEG